MNPTKSPLRASRTRISQAINAASRGESTTLMSSDWMSSNDALAIALQVIDGGTSAGRATAYLTGDLLYIGPRKLAA
jgi:hypothetical protein